MPMAVKFNASEHSLTVNLPSGRQTYDLSKLSANERSGVNELVVNHWCRENGFPDRYPDA